MAIMEIVCPHCERAIVIYAQVTTTENQTPKGPAPHNYGEEVDNLIITMIDAGLSFNQVGAVLMDRGILTPRGKKHWYASSVLRAHKQALVRRTARAA